MPAVENSATASKFASSTAPTGIALCLSSPDGRDANDHVIHGLSPSATLLLDRHYNSLTPYRKGEFNLYAVLKNDTCTVRYVEVAGNRLTLRPHNASSPIESMAIAENKPPADYLVGRVFYIGLEA